MTGNVIFQENINSVLPLMYPNKQFGWGIPQVAGPDRITPTVKAGRSCLRIIVNPGDQPAPGPPQNTERNEFINMFQPQVSSSNTPVSDVDGNTGTWNLAWSLYLDSSFQDPPKSAAHPFPWCILWQLHCPNSDGISPPLAFSISDESPQQQFNGHYTLEVRGGTIGTPNVITQNFLDMGPRLYNQWVDFSVTADFQTGDVTASVNNVQVINGNYPLLYTSNGVTQQHYMRTGCYRNPAPFVTQFWRTPLIVTELSAT